MAQEVQINVPVQGMNQDKHPMNLDAKEYPFALNANYENETGSGYPTLQNEHSNLLCVRFKPGYKVVGFISIPEQGRTIYFLTNGIDSEIGYVYNVKETIIFEDAPKECDECNPYNQEATPLELIDQDSIDLTGCTYHTIVSSRCLNFKEVHPIYGTYKITNCDVNIYWTDDFNPMRYMDITTDNSWPKILDVSTDVSGICGPVYINSLDCDKLRIFPLYNTPCIQVEDVIVGGALKAGTYQFAIAYSNVNGDALTSYGNLTNPVPIFDPKRKITDITDYLTDQTIKLNFSLDKTFRYFNIVVIKSINRTLSFELIGTYPTTFTTFTYTGNNKVAKPITINEITTKRNVYDTASVITSANRYLMFGGLKSPKELNLQKAFCDYIELIKPEGIVQWQTVRMTEGSYANPVHSANHRGFYRDEVYTLGLQFITDKGEELCAVHIPGRHSIPSDLVIPFNDDNRFRVTINPRANCTTSDRQEWWKIYNTGTDLGFAQDINGNQCVDITGTSKIQTVTKNIVCKSMYYYTADHVSYYWLNPNSGTLELITAPTDPSGLTDCFLDASGITRCLDNFLPLPGIPTLVSRTENEIEAAHDEVIPDYCEDCDNSIPDLPDPTGIANVNNIQCYLAYQAAPSNGNFCSGETTVYGYFKNYSPPVIPGCYPGSFEDNATWYTFNALSTVHQISIRTANDPVIEVFTGLCGALEDVPHGSDSFTCVNKKCVILQNLVIGKTYYVKIYSKLGQSTPSYDDFFTFCITTPNPCNQHTISVPTKYQLNCKYEYTYDEIVTENNACEALPWKYGTNSYWESTEKYPDIPEVWGALACKPIRHHKLPDNCISPYHDTPVKNPGDIPGPVESYQLNYIYPIGFRIDVNDIKNVLDYAVAQGIITEDQKKTLVKYRVIRGNRVNNKSVIAKGLIYDMWSYQDDTAKWNGDSSAQTPDVYFSNYPYNDNADDDPYLANSAYYYTFPKDRSDPYVDLRLEHPYKPSQYNNRYTFHSPEIHFNNPILGTELKIESIEYGKSSGQFANVKDHGKITLLTKHAFQVANALAGTELAVNILTETFKAFAIPGSIWQAAVAATLKLVAMGIHAYIDLYNYKVQWLTIFTNLGKARNMAWYYSSVGRYNGFSCTIEEQQRLYGISNYLYLEPSYSEYSEDNLPLRINNFNRESSVYLKLNGQLFWTHVHDTNSYIRDNSKYINSETNCTSAIDGSRQISSFYTSIKNYKPDQYGNIYNIEYLDTGFCSDILWDVTGQSNVCETVFGGDIFITRFALKRKQSFFTQNNIGLASDDDALYSYYPNMAYPIFFYDTPTSSPSGTGASIADLESIKSPTVNLDECSSGPYHTDYDTIGKKSYYYRGKMYLFSYGIPYFLVESEFNMDLRYGTNTKEYNFYPNAGNYVEWTQETNVPIINDNSYLYNRDYSKQNKESFICSQSIAYDPASTCQTVFPNRVIYSLEDSTDLDGVDQWTVFRPNDFYDFSASNGKLIGLQSLESNVVLARFENILQAFNAYAKIQATPFNIQVGNGSIFSQTPIEYAKTTLGYGGTQNKAFLSTELGHFFVDAKRGHVFSVQSQLDEISANGMKNWFKENLPFNISKDFPELSIDNPYNGAGIVIGYDSKFRRIFITKLDYKLLSNWKGRITYDQIENKFWLDNQTPVELRDPTYFCDKSFTIAYNPLTKSWMSFYTFLPNYYISYNDFFQTGINRPYHYSHGLWSHLLTPSSYQVFYGKLNPFEIEFVTKDTLITKVLNSIEYTQDAFRFQTDYDYFSNPGITFNKAYIYSETQHTGVLNLNVREMNNMRKSIVYPKYNATSIDIEVVNKESNWNFNQFGDMTRSKLNNIPIMSYKCSSYYKQPNFAAIDYYKPLFEKGRLRNDYFRIRLINDKYSNYKFVSKWNISKENKSIT